MATVFTSFSLGKSRRTTNLPTGTIMAPPKPCRIRDRVNSNKVVLKPHSTDAKVKMAIAAINIVRAPNLSAA